MSDLTDFFPSTGGSSDITDPKMLPRLAIGPVSQARYIKTALSTLSHDGSDAFWNTFTKTSLADSVARIGLSTTTFDTYQTLLDISSSTNGGYLNYILGSYIQQNQTETYKITVDGVATEIARTVPTGAQYQCGVLGWISPGRGSLTNTQAGGPGSMGEQSANISTYSSTSNSSSNGFTYGHQSAYTLPDHPWAYPNLRFKETLKIEIKRSGIYAANLLYNYAGVRYTMI